MALRKGRYHARLIGHTKGDDPRPLYGASCDHPRLLGKEVGLYPDDKKDLYVVAGCGSWKHAKKLDHFVDGRDLYAFADPCCGSGSGSASASGSASSGLSGGITCCICGGRTMPPPLRLNVLITHPEIPDCNGVGGHIDFSPTAYPGDEFNPPLCGWAGDITVAGNTFHLILLCSVGIAGETGTGSWTMAFSGCTGDLVLAKDPDSCQPFAMHLGDFAELTGCGCFVGASGGANIFIYE